MDNRLTYCVWYLVYTGKILLQPSFFLEQAAQNLYTFTVMLTPGCANPLVSTKVGICQKFQGMHFSKGKK